MSLAPDVECGATEDESPNPKLETVSVVGLLDWDGSSL